jgi:hypothetical protein
MKTRYQQNNVMIHVYRITIKYRPLPLVHATLGRSFRSTYDRKKKVLDRG